MQYSSCGSLKSLTLYRGGISMSDACNLTCLSRQADTDGSTTTCDGKTILTVLHTVR